MLYTVEYRKKAQKALIKMPVKISNGFKESFNLLSQDIERTDLDTRKLSGRDGFRLRIGSYRALYLIDNNSLIILVVKVGSRGDIYK